jgi:hypothetical protein
LEIDTEFAMDKVEIVSIEETIETKVRKFNNCLKTKAGTALNFLETAYQVYAPGIGLIKDLNLILTKYGFIE